MIYFFSVFSLSISNVFVEGLVYSGRVSNVLGAIFSYIEIFLILGLLFFRKINFAGIVYVTLLGSALTEVNFLQEQGFVTSTTYLLHPGFQAIRVPGLTVGWSTVIGFLVLAFALCGSKKDILFNEKLNFFKEVIWFGLILLVLSVVSIGKGSFSIDIFKKDISTFLIAIFSLGVIFLNLTSRQLISILVAIILGTWISSSLLYFLGIARFYAGEQVALSVPAHAYILILPLLLSGIKTITRIFIFFLVLTFTVNSGFLISGKTVMSILLLVFLLLVKKFHSQTGSKTRIWTLFIAVSPLFLIDYTAVGDFFIGQGYELAGYKIKQLDFIDNFNELEAVSFFVSSGGNLVGEAMTVIAMLVGIIPEHFPLLGLGFGGQVNDYFNVLSLSNPDSYPESAFLSGKFSGFHIAILEYILWGGIFGVRFAWLVIKRYFFKSDKIWIRWTLLISFLIFGFSSKFDTALFALLISLISTHAMTQKLSEKNHQI